MNGEPFHAPLVQRFVAAVRRRILLIRLAESAAIASAIASAAGMVLILILWNTDQSGIMPALAILTLGALCGIVWGISRRPTRLEAAFEADRQLALHDLLVTVLLMDRTATGDLTTAEWRQSLAATAEDRCRVLRPSAVVAARLNLRAWGGVAVSTALLLTLGILSSHPLDLRAAPSTGEIAPADAAPQPADLAVTGVATDRSATASARPAGGATLEDSARNFPSDADHPDDSAPDPSGGAGNRGSSAAADTGHHGVGGAMAVTHVTLPPTDFSALSHDRPNSSNKGNSASGSGSADPNAKSRGAAGDPGNGTVADFGRSGRASSSKSSAKSADSATAEQAIQTGRVPDTETDLVRDYFQGD